ncbi:MAG: DNRLRE domain-containing protein [Anaerolineales bacterium]|nr:DNRLRE domain-containing protein [Anaerolineales bacterium]
MNKHFTQMRPLFLGMITLAILIFSHQQPLSATPATTEGGVVRRVNVPYTSAQVGDPDGIPVPERAIFWFGEVGPTTSNYTDVRVIYNDAQLHVTAHVFDRLLRYDTSPAASDLDQWDAVSLYLHTNGNSGSTPTNQSYRFVAQFNFNEARSNYEAAYRGNGSGWAAANVDFETVDGWQGAGPNDDQIDRGWNVTFRIPFSSLGLSGPPSNGTIWGFALVVHDRDTANGSPPIPNQIWPEAMNANQPGSWAQLRFGIPTYSPPLSTPAGEVIIRDGTNGTVKDAQVGGNANCGIPPMSNGGQFWPQWGSINYAGTDFALYMNIQNQWNLGDANCFSKYYITFPLQALPSNKVIRSATLVITQFGNANQGGQYPDPPEPSLLQVLTVDEDWQENSITWNNAPMAVENISFTEIGVMAPGSPQIARELDVSRAVAQAYAQGQPLRLALYSADGELHSGKYFRASDVDVASARPTLIVRLGDAAPPTDWAYLPIVR